MQAAALADNGKQQQAGFLYCASHSLIVSAKPHCMGCRTNMFVQLVSLGLQGRAGGVSTGAIQAELSAIQADHKRLRYAMMQNL